MNPETEARKARQREEGKVAMAEYLKNQRHTLKRMEELKAQRLERETSPDESQEKAQEKKRVKKREKKIDEALKESFPASDPPAFVGH
jgi:hypothetical protein